VEPLLALGFGFALGLSLAVPPGPVNALVSREASRHGMWGGIRAGLPAPIVDTCYMLLVLFGLTKVLDVERWAPVMGGVGAALMAFLAWDTARHRATPKQLAGPLSVWAVTLTNPFQYAWWLSAGAAFLTKTGAWGIPGFLAAIFGWVFALSFLVNHGARRWDWFVPLITVASADMLLFFALALASQTA
jgi:threonine/homoserine/homoserine lactone efflux protein